MSQSFTELQGNDTLTNSRTTINNNFNALKSGFSGTEPPFEATADTFGSTYFNTTDNRTYQVIKQGTSYTWGLPKENLHTTGNESFSGTLDATTGTITVATQAATDNSTKAANTAFVRLKVPASVGSATKPVYTNANGVVVASNATVGSTSQPVYLNNGTITAITGAIANNITGNAATATMATTAGTCTGNSATATKLATTKKINGTDFDGSADITTNNWGTARNVVIADSDNTNVGVATSVNGSTNITLKLPATIKASLLGNASTATLASSATNATNDASGNNIANTYATKTELDQKSSFKLFHHDWFDYQLNDQDWLRADTFSWQNGTVYTNAYNHLVADYNNPEPTETLTYNNLVWARDSSKDDTANNFYAWVNQSEIVFTQEVDPTISSILYSYDEDDGYLNIGAVIESVSLQPAPRTETVGSYTITYYLATDGHKICLPDQETTVANIYTESGVAWYYILDTANQRFKLPRTKYGFVGVRDTVGNYVPESLPDYVALSGYNGRAGQFRQKSVEYNYTASLFQNDTADSTSSSTNYGTQVDVLNYRPVQQRATQMYLYFYVGQFSQSAIEQTAGLNSELFNGKADIEALNNKIQLVSTLPATQTNGVLYVIPE